MAEKERVLFVNDDEHFVKNLIDRTVHSSIDVEWAQTLANAEVKLRTTPYKIIILKNPLADGSAFHKIPDLLHLAPSAGVILCSSEGSGQEAERAIRNGVVEYLPYPLSVQDLLSAIEKLSKHLDRKGDYRPDPKKCDQWFEMFISHNPLFLSCLELAQKAAETDVNVLITGETGTGKELLAQGIHNASDRSRKNFVVVDCASLPQNLVESTLFGHEKGSFTSAEYLRSGLVQDADGGTLFLDEIGELPPAIQKSFLRVLDTKTFRRVGGNRELSSDFRLIVATNKDMDALVAEGRFRQDLLYRIKTIQINMPTLRSRPDDIEPLARHHLERYSKDLGQPLKRLSSEFISSLKDYSWPGNIRELFNALERSVTAAGTEDVLHRFHLPVAIRADSARRIAQDHTSKKIVFEDKRIEEDGTPFPTLADFRQAAITEAETEYLLNLIQKSDGDVDKAVSLSGLSRSRLYALLKNYDLSLKK